MALPTSWLALAALCGGFALPTSDPPAPTEPAVGAAESPRGADALLARVVVVGASVSGGFGLSSELEVEVGFERFLDAAWTHPQPGATNLASARFFIDPDRSGERQRDAARKLEPTLLVAVDFLFWFGYGSIANEPDRLALLEQGLALLDSIEAPMLVGDFPDMRPALLGEGLFGMPMIDERQIPEPETLAALNARVDAWAEERPRVVRVPLAEFVERLHEGGDLSVRSLRWTGERASALLQSDLLHASAEGTAALTMLALDALERARPDLSPDDVSWSPGAVLEGVRAATAEERATVRARRERAEQQRRRREERRERDGEEADERADDGARDAA